MKVDLGTQMRVAGLSPEPEYAFHPTRAWRFDWAFLDAKVAVEREGGTWGQEELKLAGPGKLALKSGAGRHTRGKGYRDDCEKYNEAQILGWVVLRFTADQVASGYALAAIERALKSREG